MEKFEFEIFYYGDLAFIWGFLGEFTINDAKEASWKTTRLMSQIKFTYGLKFDRKALVNTAGNQILQLMC